MKKAQKDWRMGDAFAEPQADNGDNYRLRSMKVVDHVSQLNGAGAEEFPDFHPTKDELIILAGHWAEIAMNIEHRWHPYYQCGRSEIRRRPYAWARVDEISSLVGEEVDVAVDAFCRTYAAEQQRSDFMCRLAEFEDAKRWRLITKLRHWIWKFRVRRGRK